MLCDAVLTGQLQQVCLVVSAILTHMFCWLSASCLCARLLGLHTAALCLCMLSHVPRTAVLQRVLEKTPGV